MKQLGLNIYNAEKEITPVETFTDQYPDMTEEEAYGVQLAYVDHRLEDGAEIVGKKIGLTSKAMQEMLGVDKPDYGHIFDDMVYDSKINSKEFIWPRVEFEIGFKLKKDIDSNDISFETVTDAIDYALPVAEVIDSRIKDWKIKFEDTVSDNGSSAGMIIGDGQKPLSEIDLPDVKMEVFKNDEKLDEGYGSAVLGNPLEAVVWLAKSLSEYDITLKKGEVILAGALTKAVDIKKGDHFKATFENLGEVSLIVE